MASERYREKNDVHVPVVDHLVSSGRYVETWGDPEATGGRVDTVGNLDGHPTAIEFKVSVGSGVASFRREGTWSVEAKMSGVLGPLYRGQTDPVSAALRDSGFGSVPARFVLVAASYTADAIVELKQMFETRSREWCFSYSVWRWTGAAIEEISSGGCVAWPEDFLSANVEIPVLVPAGKPRRSLGRDGMREALGERRSMILDEISQASSNRGWKISFIGNTAVIRTRRLPIATIYATPDDQGPGLVVGVDLAAGAYRSVDEVPGTVVNGKGIGHRNVTRRIASVEEFTAIAEACGH